MIDLQSVIAAIEDLTREDREQVYQYLAQRHTARHILPAESPVRIDELMKPVQDQAEQMTENEVFATIDQTITAVRCA